MATYRYRAATATGNLRTGMLEGTSRTDVIERIKRLGLTPIDAVETAARAQGTARLKLNSAGRQSMINTIGELAVLLNAGLSLDRALAVSVDNIGNPGLKAVFAGIRDKVRQGIPLSRAMIDSGAFPPMASAMAEAGEASGKLDESLTRLAETLDRAEALRQTVISSMVYPALLMTIATGVILVMLLFVVPQFEDLFSEARAKLPFMTRVILGASHALKSYGLIAFLALVIAGFSVARWLRKPSVRLAADRKVLNAPMIGPLISKAQTSRFARTLGSLLDGGVPLPSAIAIAQRSLSNTHMASAINRVASGLKQGGGLTNPLAATGLFPPMALSFLRTGEETAQLGLMLRRLADVLDREVNAAIQRLIGILTPAITVGMGAIVATVIASIMSAILGFNDLALGP
jgi:general secretion pathway protein F